MRIEIVCQSRRDQYRLRQLRKWAARTIDVADMGLSLICGAAVVAAFIIGMAADSDVPVDVIMGSVAACLMVALAAWLIRKVLRREL